MLILYLSYFMYHFCNIWFTSIALVAFSSSLASIKRPMNVVTVPTKGWKNRSSSDPITGTKFVIAWVAWTPISGSVVLVKALMNNLQNPARYTVFITSADDSQRAEAMNMARAFRPDSSLWKHWSRNGISSGHELFGSSCFARMAIRSAHL